MTRIIPAAHGAQLGDAPMRGQRLWNIAVAPRRCVSVIGLGTNRFGTAQLPQAEVNNILDAVLDMGINFIDASDTTYEAAVKKRPGRP